MPSCRCACVLVTPYNLAYNKSHPTIACVSHTLQPCLQQVTPYNCLCQSHPTTLPTTSHTLQLPVLVTPYNLAYNKSHPTIACVSHTLQMLTTRAESRIPGKEQRVLCRSNASQ